MEPYLITFKSIGETSIGYISVAEGSSDLPFEIRRAYWTYFTPHDITRGGHANIDKEVVLVAVCGVIQVTVIQQNGRESNFRLDLPNIGLYIPKLCWHKMHYSHAAVQLALASNYFSNEDYIRDFDTFLRYGK
jgi:hypothetical protein